MDNYVCSVCGAKASYDGRMGDGPYLTCECSRHTAWHDDGRGGYTYNTLGAEAVPFDSEKASKTTTVIKNGNTTVIIIKEDKWDY